jgi:hypothetical protein
MQRHGGTGKSIDREITDPAALSSTGFDGDHQATED